MLGAMFGLCRINSLKVTLAVLATAFVAFIILLLIKPLRSKKALALFLASVALSAALTAFHAARVEQNITEYADKRITAVGTLAELPYKAYGHNYYIIKTSRIGNEHKRIKLRVSSLDSLDLEPTDEIRVTLNTQLLGGDDGEYLGYCKSENLYLSGYLGYNASCDIAKGCDFSPFQLILMLKRSISGYVMSSLPNSYGGVLCALLTGDRHTVPEVIKNRLSASGVFHLFAVSGLHLSVWSALLYEALKKARVSAYKRSVTVIIFCIVFILLTGANPPVVRAGFMMILFYCGYLFSRQSDALNSIGLAVLCMLILNPFASLSASLWMSVLATAGIITAAVPFVYYLTEKLDKINGILKSAAVSIATVMSVTVFSSLFTLPVFIYCFGRVSTVGIAANLVLVFAGSLAMELSGTAFLLNAVSLGFLAKPVITLAGLLSKFLTDTSSLLADFRYALIPVSSTVSKITLAVCAAAVILIFFIKKKDRKVLFSSLLVSFVLLLCVNVFTFTLENSKLKLAVINTGEGVGVVLKNKGFTAVADTASGSFDENKIKQTVSDFCISRLDYLLLPLCNGDAYLADCSVLCAYEPKILVVPEKGMPKDTNGNYKVLNTDREKIILINDEIALSSDEKCVKIDYKKFSFRVFDDGRILLSDGREYSVPQGKRAELFTDGNTDFEIKEAK